MTEAVEKHKHCQICGLSILPDDDFCSDVCSQKYDLLMKRRKSQLYLFYGVIIALMAVLVIFQGFGSGT